MPGERGRWLRGRRQRRTSDDDLLSALLIRVRALESGRSLPRNVPPGQLSKEELIGFWADDLNPAAGHHAARIAFSGQVCSMLKFDIAGFTRKDRDEEARIYLRKAFYGMLREALEESGMAWERCHREDCGDGALIIVPPGIPAHWIIDPFPGQLRDRIRVYNRMTIPAGQIQVRAAAHIGLVYRDEHGLAGDSVNLLSRMLDAEPLHAALASSDAELALIISEYIHDNLILRHPARAPRTPFRAVNTEVKGTQISAWIHVPGLPPQLQRTRADWFCAVRGFRLPPRPGDANVFGLEVLEQRGNLAFRGPATADHAGRRGRDGGSYGLPVLDPHRGARRHRPSDPAGHQRLPRQRPATVAAQGRPARHHLAREDQGR